MISFLFILVCIIHTICDAIADAKVDTIGKRIHWLKSFSILILIGTCYFSVFIGFDPLFLVYLILIRFSLFDTIYNDVSNNDLNYTGVTGSWSKFLKILPDWLEYSLRGISFLLVILLAYLSDKYLIIIYE